MLINGIELSSLGVKLYDRVISSNQVNTQEAWLEGDIQPTSIRQQDSFKSIQLKFLVLCQDEDEAYLRISKLTQVLKKATLQFDDMDYIFEVSMNGKANPTRLKNGNFIVSYSFTSGYAIGEKEIYTTNANLTNYFKLNVAYYQDSATLLSAETINIRASQFDEEVSFGDLIDLNKYLPRYYNNGVVTNFGNRELNYQNLKNLGIIIINYEPIVYNVTVNYMVDNGSGIYNDLVQTTNSFTYPQVVQAQSIGQIIDLASYKPEGYKTSIVYNGGLTVEEILAAAPLYVFYQKLNVNRTKTITVTYLRENDNNGYDTISVAPILFKESDFTEGQVLKDVINLNANKPANFYNDGYFDGAAANTLITFDTLEDAYTIKYSKTVYNLLVEYYLGNYPDWSRLTTITVPTVWREEYQTNFSANDLNINLNQYHTSEYRSGALYGGADITSFNQAISLGILQVYYSPIEYTIQVRYSAEDNTMVPVTETFTITALDFLSTPVLNDIIPVTLHRPNGYQFSTSLSYHGDITLAALTQHSPIDIIYEQIEEIRAKNIIIRYKKEMASAQSTINTSLITINESDVQGGIRLRDLFNINAYRPEYYENGIIDGYSETALNTFDELQSSYDVIYFATSYNTQVKYYTDDVDDLNWIGSSIISYRVIDFEVGTTLYDLGLDINLYKTAALDDGVLQYTGPVSFLALRNLASINVLYDTVLEPDDSGIDYPHRFLFLQHNDMGAYEYLYPTWTLNHAYINTGVTCDDMSKLTIICECARVDEYTPLHEVNDTYAYLFGSYSGLGAIYMRFHNLTQRGRSTQNMPGYNLYEAKCGLNSNELSQLESQAIGFSTNTGIYALDRVGYSTATFTYSNLLANEPVPVVYPIYLFANNYAGVYNNGLAGYGIYSCRIYYNGALIRDYIPVQFYDKIGDKVAPSNCLYDKVTQTFFEDATHQNSFNIMDDDRYEDTNLEHKIGRCIVNYYKGENLFQTLNFYFRGNDFTGAFNPYEKFMVDDYQPAYYHSGVIQDYNQKNWTFNGMNNQTYSVIYEEAENHIVVNYYVEEDGTRTLLQTEEIGLEERNFYQAPTFGEIVRINKYKPAGYETDFQYEGGRVSLARVIDNSPYDIVYKPIQGDLQIYTTTIRYIKKVYGIRAYEVIGTTTLSFDQSHFREGEFLDYYINWNSMKPATYYSDGEPYQWYKMDEIIDNPSKLKESYTILYSPETQYIEINYYTDDWDEANLIASSTWAVRVDDFESGYPISFVDSLPNEYINKYKPANCGGGVIQNVKQTFADFDELMEVEEIAIQYDSIAEPSDPETASYEKKMLYWGDPFTESYNEVAYPGVDGGDTEYQLVPNPDYGLPGEGQFITIEEYIGGRIPWIDLGYKPKEIGRLRVEIKAYANPMGVSSVTTTWGYQTYDYLYYFGYWGPINPSFQGVQLAHRTALINSAGNKRIEDWNFSGSDNYMAKTSPGSSGCFGIRGRIPEASGWVYTTQGPTTIDGQLFSTAQSQQVARIELVSSGMSASYRKGYFADTDDNYNPIKVNNTYSFARTDREEWKFEHFESYPYEWMKEYHPRIQVGNTLYDQIIGNPYTIILDAYNSYGAIWREGDSNTPVVYNFDESDDLNLFEDVCSPKGTLSLFQTTNPMDGRINVMAFDYITYPFLGNSGSMNLSGQLVGQNPYSADFNGVVSDTQLTITGYTDGGEPIYEEVQVNRNIAFATFPMMAFPQLRGCAVWHIKIYDRNRLVRDLIPVATGDEIYDYTMPANGLFDLVTEIFFGNSNHGGTYSTVGTISQGVSGEFTRTVKPENVLPLYCIPDPLVLGKVTGNYYDYDNTLLGTQFIDIPTWYNPNNETLADILRFDDFKPDDFHLDGMIDLDGDFSRNVEGKTLVQIYHMNAFNVFYKLRTFTKTVVYYRGNVRIGSRDLFYSLDDIKNANTLDDLGIDVDLYYDSHFKHGRISFDESILASNDVQAFIDAPSPIVVYDKFSYSENNNILYVEYYRGGAYDDTLITLDENNPNYLNCDLTGVVLNPNGAIKYYNHYHTALYEDETNDTFIPYQVKVLNMYAGIHRGPARKYPTLAMIIQRDTYTIIEERNGWGRLKEYPIGWILLNQTEPITGPGQNPDYDVPGQDVATIPFGEHINVSKMTIDRLWLYIEEQESWVKAEDVSLDQSGKLYNGIAIEWKDLSSYNSSSSYTLESMGLSRNKYRLRFHEPGLDDGWFTGAKTLTQLKMLHSLDVVYPETVYTYNCIYYSYYKDANNELGRHGFSCSISDWNPDWDKFIETSYQTTEEIDYGYLTWTFGSNSSSEYFYTEPDYDSEHAFVYTNPVVLKIVGEDITNRKGTYTPVETMEGTPGYYWHTQHQQGQNQFRVIKEYGGTITVDLDPTLYRDTELTLDWDYFGCFRNAYRPTGFGSGIYLWNPRSWNKDNNRFTFRELIKCGTQYVVYPPFEPDTYKLWSKRNQIAFTGTGLYNGGVPVDLRGVEDYYYFVNKGDTALYDIYTSGEAMPMQIDLYDYTHTWRSWWNLLQNSVVDTGMQYYGKLGNSLATEVGDTFIWNVSNKRQSPVVVFGKGNVYDNRETEYYALKEYQTFANDKEWIRITDNLNLNNFEIDRYSFSPSSWYLGYPTQGTNYLHNMESAYDVSGEVVQGNAVGYRNFGLYGVIYDTMAYENGYLIHYWVPVPKGLRYYWNGDFARIEDNGLFDLLTGEFSRSYRLTDGNITYGQTSWTPVRDGQDIILLRNAPLNAENYYDYFSSWDVAYQTLKQGNVENVLGLVQNETVTKTSTGSYPNYTYSYVLTQRGPTQTYNRPDLYSTPLRIIPNGVFIPVEGTTNHSIDQKVTEEVNNWYLCGDEWLPSNQIAVLTYMINGSNKIGFTESFSVYDTQGNEYHPYPTVKEIKKEKRTICLMPHPSTNQIYLMKKPGIDTPLTNNGFAPYGNVSQVISSYFYVTDTNDNIVAFFDGQGWVPVEYTQYNSTNVNENYVVSTNTAAYSYPIENTNYRMDTFHYGDRITVTKKSANDENWLYTGQYWVKNTGSNLSIIE